MRKKIRSTVVLCCTGFLTYSVLLLCCKNLKTSSILLEVPKENPVIMAIQDTTASLTQNVSDCKQLFKNESSAHSFSMTKDFRSNIAEFLSVVDVYNAAYKTGHIYMVEDQYKLFHYLAWKLKFVHTICETGVNISNNYCKKLNSLKHLLRATVAESHN